MKIRCCCDPLLLIAVLASPFTLASSSIEHRKLRRVHPEKVVPREYVVVYKRGTDPSKKKRRGAKGADIHRASTSASLEDVSDDELLEILEDQDVEYVQPNMVISLDDDVPTEIIVMDKDGGRLRGLAMDKNQGSMVTHNENYDLWGLDRINQDSLPFDDIYTYSHTGATVDVFVIDTGIRVSHQEFEGRARCGWSWKEYRQDCYDGDGHGTHCAGIIGGALTGVAKKANLIAVKALSDSGTGTLNGLLAAFDYVMGEKRRTGNPSIVSMSLGFGEKVDIVDNTVDQLIQEGIVVVSAAGNDSSNACFSSPGANRRGITVGSIRWEDTRSSWSNWGNCIDLFAPGSSIFSSYIYEDFDTYYAYLSGTSMATPAVAGAAALFLQMQPSASHARVKRFLSFQATFGKVKNPGSGSPNLLLRTNIFRNTNGSCRGLRRVCRSKSDCCSNNCRLGLDGIVAFCRKTVTRSTTCLANKLRCSTHGQCCSGRCALNRRTGVRKCRPKVA